MKHGNIEKGEIEKLERRLMSGIMLTLLLISMFTLAFNIQGVKASETIGIRPDGSVIPSTAPLLNIGNFSYILTANIYEPIVVWRDNIVIDGAGHTIQGKLGFVKGMTLSWRSNVTIKNMEIKGFEYGIWLSECSSINISDNNIGNNGNGIYLTSSSGNSISGNNVTNNSNGIWLVLSSNNNISDNNIQNWEGIVLSDWTLNNIISGNQITNNYYGIVLSWDSMHNVISNNNITNNKLAILPYYSSINYIYHNNFIDNTGHVIIYDSMSVWDDGYPSGGNYWSDYAGVDLYGGPYQNLSGSDGIGDTPYIIDANNIDHYPFMKPWTPTPPNIMASVEINPETLNLESNGKWITAYIQLPESYNPADIDATTILLNDTISPVLDPKYGFVTNSSEYLVDHNNDGILERMVKFDRATMESWIYQKIGMQSDVSLTITGKLFDGTLFEGTDTIFVFWTNHRPPSRR